MTTLDAIFSPLDRDRSLAAYSAVARKLKTSLRDGADLPLAPFRLAILANHTFDIETTMSVECARRGLNASFYQAGFDQYRQELLDARSGLDAFAPDAVLLSLDLARTFSGVTPATCAATGTLPDSLDWAEGLKNLLKTYRLRSAAPVFVLDFLPPSSTMDGLLGSSEALTVFEWVMGLNRALHRAVSGVEAAYVVGAGELACRSGLGGWRDPRLALLARAGINPKMFPMLASHIARHLAALRRPPAKCLVLDLDNTLWGGVLGEVGAEGILCADTDYPASAFADFQRAVLALRSRGILLAVASKNDAGLVEEAFRTCTTMPLRAEHISAWEANWNPKPQSIQRIAASLNIGLDSVIFLDDNPDEILLVKMSLPSVRAYLMPPHPEDFTGFLAGLEDFDQLRLSAEDTRRAELYALRSRAIEEAAASTNLESFYRSLGTVLLPEPAGAANFERVLQLIAKTNQFNLTTRRHTRAELAERMARGCEVWAFRVTDVHGDHGIIAVALVDFNGVVCRIDTLLMSCRVIGRTIETAMLHFLEGRAAARGASVIEGEFLPTAKNAPCREFYGQHGFTAASNARWTKNLGNGFTSCPEWIAIKGENASLCAKT